MSYKFIEKETYQKNKDYYISLINGMYQGDNNKIANIEETKKFRIHFFITI